MANANGQITSRHPISVAPMGWVTAGLLIASGSALQLGEWGFGPYQPANRWVFAVVARGAWHTLNLLDGQTLKFVAHNWPLLLVLFGIAILPLMRQGYRAGECLTENARIGEDHGG